MIGKEDSQEEVSYKVSDRRKFNPDGSLKEGVTIEPEPPQDESKAAAPTEETRKAEHEQPLSAEASDDELGEETEIPGRG